MFYNEMTERSDETRQICEVITACGGLLTRTDIESECPVHGKYIAHITKLGNKVVGTTGCPSCARENEERLAQELARQELEAASKREAERVEKALQRSRIPADFKRKTFDSFVADTENQRGALALAKRFVAGFEKAKEGGYGLLFHGNCGTGKSHLACAILQALMPSVDGLYTRVSDIVRYVRSTWSKSSDVSDFDAIQLFVDVDLLVIDEVGVQAGSENEKQILFSVIDARLSENRPTIFLTNLEPQELPKCLGIRIADRIKGKCVLYRFTGESKRQPLSADVFDVEATA